MLTLCLDNFCFYTASILKSSAYYLLLSLHTFTRTPTPKITQFPTASCSQKKANKQTKVAGPLATYHKPLTVNVYTNSDQKNGTSGPFSMFGGNTKTSIICFGGKEMMRTKKIGRFYNIKL